MKKRSSWYRDPPPPPSDHPEPSFSVHTDSSIHFALITLPVPDGVDILYARKALGPLFEDHLKASVWPDGEFLSIRCCEGSGDILLRWDEPRRHVVLKCPVECPKSKECCETAEQIELVLREAFTSTEKFEE